MQQTPNANRLHIALFGCRNVGKSSIINALVQQPVALVSAVAGTTTDPVYKAMELLPLGPVLFIDTPGIDDVGQLGQLRIERTLAVLAKTDLAIVVITRETEPAVIVNLLHLIQEKNIPIIGVLNKIDEPGDIIALLECWQGLFKCPLITASALSGQGIDKLKQTIIQSVPEARLEQDLLSEIVVAQGVVILVVPIDTGAPKGRLILPQVQTLRAALEQHCLCLVVQPEELTLLLSCLKIPPQLVITDSQIFEKVAAIIPSTVALTSFSILMARQRGDLNVLAAGAQAISALKPGDKVLIAEGCTHHRQDDDIGQVKIPRWLERAVGGKLQFFWVSGSDFPPSIVDYNLIVHCGACMLSRRQMLTRLAVAADQGVPIVNYGVLIAYLHGILPRALQPFNR